MSSFNNNYKKLERLKNSEYTTQFTKNYNYDKHSKDKSEHAIRAKKIMETPPYYLNFKNGDKK